jgi:hypothetical protein
MRLLRPAALVALSWLSIGAISQSGTAAPPHTAGYNGVGHSSVPGCPDMVWRLVRTGSNVSGIAYYSDLSGLSMVKGTVNSAGHFQLTLTPQMGEGPSATVTGVRKPNGSAQAEMTGKGCANMHISMQPVTDVNHWTNFGGGGAG